MADTKPTMSGGQGGSTEPKVPLNQPQDAVELKKIPSAIPAVPAKDDATTTIEDPASSTSIKGKEKEAASATGPSSKDPDELSIAAADTSAQNFAEGPVCTITLLLPTGARHPYRLDEKYLTKRNVEVPEMTKTGQMDPFSISVYKVKELILREWRDEWDGKPTSPTSIRLIHFGKLLEDKEQLKKYQFMADAPNVVHMSVKPAEMLEEDEAGKGKSGSSSGRNSDSGSGCCVIL